MNSAKSSRYYMTIALEEAEKAGRRGEIPIGAVLVDAGGEILARDGNRSIELADPSGHAEILVLRQAGIKLANYRLLNTVIYVTLEPCVMCAGALVQARLAKLVIGADDPKSGAVYSLFDICNDARLNHQVEIEKGVLAEECGSLLRDFFKTRRQALKKESGS